MVIGLSGKSGTGKTVLADHLAEMLNGHRHSFGETSRTSAPRLLGSLDIREFHIIDDVQTIKEANAIDAVGGIIIRLQPYDNWRNDTTHDNDLLEGYQGFIGTFWPEFGGLMQVASIITDKVKE